MRGGLSSGVEINTIIYIDLHCQVAFLEGVASCQGGLSKEVPLYVYTVVSFFPAIHNQHGLAWTDGQAVYLAPLSLLTDPPERLTSVKLGEFEYVKI